MHPGVYIVVAVFILIIVFGIIWQRKLNRSKENIYIDFAHKHNLEILTADLTNHFIHLKGEIDGIQFELYEERQGNSNDSPTWTYLAFKNFSFDFDFQISCENVLMKAFEKIASYSNVRIGNEELDGKFVFHAKETSKMERFLDTLDEMKLLELYDDFLGMLENDRESNYFRYVHQGRIIQQYQMESIEKTLDFMRHLINKRTA